MEMLTGPSKWLLFGALAIAAVWDWRTRRIPNGLICTGMAIALCVQLLAHGAAAGTWAWFSGWLTGMGLFLGFYLLRGMGAGDVKLMGVVGAFTSPAAALTIGVVACVFGGIMALAVMLCRKQRNDIWHALLVTVTTLQSKEAASLRALSQGLGKSGTRLPYALAIAAGAWLVSTGWL